MAMNGLSFLNGSGTSAAKIRSLNWEKTELGPPSGWPDSLKTIVSMMLSSKFPKALVWGKSMTMIYNDAFAPILGNKPEPMARPFKDVWAEVWNEIGPLAEKAYAGESIYIENFPLTINRHGYEEDCYFTFCYSPIYDETGRICGMMDTVMETTETVMVQRQVSAVNAELRHRMGNLVAMVSALAGQTFRGEEAMAERLSVFQDRLKSLGEAQAMLTAEDHPEATIKELVDSIVGSRMTARDRIAVDGPVVALKGRKALSLSLALNELFTNSIKYGALSSETGRINIQWALRDAQFSFRWSESGGPIVAKPTRQGFGTKLIERFVAAHFEGNARIDYRPEGVEYQIVSNSANLDF
ncbi:MAG: histidine kinase [Rhizobiales bacterium]|nr:histidine kinase [Hyphomicrobiales bacterium]MBA70787.1 histidine kinase [Hyphomicrobiales bacterium]|tara:strand:+ start:924 stop:1988 length:1065 start_codon:yes stop_codon:yes gene_type:complete